VDEKAAQDVAGHDGVPAGAAGGGHELVDGGLDGVAALGADGGVSLLGRPQAAGHDLVGRLPHVATEVPEQPETFLLFGSGVLVVAGAGEPAGHGRRRGQGDVDLLQ
jgi:hypothetical protein